MNDLLEQPTRRRIFDVISDHPGASARDVQRRAELAWGETAYHLDQLTRAGILRRERGGGRDYYFPPQMTWDDRKLLLALRSRTERRILVALVESPGLTLAEVRERAGTSLSTASFHLRHLLDLAAAESFHSGNQRRYRARDPQRLTNLLGQFRDSFEDRVVERFVETWSSLL